MTPRRGDLLIGPWGASMDDRAIPCAIGRRGIVADKREGDGATPAGVWRLRRVLWRADLGPRPRTGLPCVPIGPDLGWGDDPARPAYNRPLALSARGPRPGAERMRRADALYRVVVETDWNAAGVPGAGSAIFLHVWRGPRMPTAGCVAFPEPALRGILARWTPERRVIVRG